MPVGVLRGATEEHSPYLQESERKKTELVMRGMAYSLSSFSHQPIMGMCPQLSLVQASNFGEQYDPKVILYVYISSVYTETVFTVYGWFYVDNYVF